MAIHCHCRIAHTHAHTNTNLLKMLLIVVVAVYSVVRLFLYLILRTYVFIIVGFLYSFPPLFVVVAALFFLFYFFFLFSFTCSIPLRHKLLFVFLLFLYFYFKRTQRILTNAYAYALILGLILSFLLFLVEDLLIQIWTTNSAGSIYNFFFVVALILYKNNGIEMFSKIINKKKKTNIGKNKLIYNKSKYKYHVCRKVKIDNESKNNNRKLFLCFIILCPFLSYSTCCAITVALQPLRNKTCI